MADRMADSWDSLMAVHLDLKRGPQLAGRTAVQKDPRKAGSSVDLRVWMLVAASAQSSAEQKAHESAPQLVLHSVPMKAAPSDDQTADPTVGMLAVW